MQINCVIAVYIDLNENSLTWKNDLWIDVNGWMRERENDGQLIRHTDDRGWKWSMLLQNKLRFWPLSVCCMCAYRDWFIIEKFKVIFADILHSCFGWLSHWCFWVIWTRGLLESNTSRRVFPLLWRAWSLNWTITAHSVSTCVSVCLSACV